MHEIHKALSPEVLDAFAKAERRGANGERAKRADLARLEAWHRSRDRPGPALEGEGQNRHERRRAAALAHAR